MLNLELFKTEVKNQARDILVYEVYYYDDNYTIMKNFKKEMDKYIEIFWSTYTINFNCYFGLEESNTIFCNFDIEDIQCGFQFCLQIDMYKRLRYGVG